MKKTLQRELKYQALPNDKHSSDKLNEPQLQAHKTLSTTSTSSNSESPVSSNSASKLQQTTVPKRLQLYSSTSGLNVTKKISNSDMSALHEDVNFKYLKHVVIKFLTSREYEVLNFKE